MSPRSNPSYRDSTVRISVLAGIQVVVLQGERPLAKDNKKLGMSRLDDIPAAPKGRLQWVILVLGIDAPSLAGWFIVEILLK